MRFSIRLFVAAVLALFVAFLAVPVLAAQPPVAAVDINPFGLLADFLTQTKGQISVLITSAVGWVFNKWSDVTKDWSNTKVYFLLIAIGVVVAGVVAALGGSLSSDPHTWTITGITGLFDAGVAAIIYKLGQFAQKQKQAPLGSVRR